MLTIINKVKNEEDFKEAGFFKKILGKAQRKIKEKEVDIDDIYNQLCVFFDKELSKDYCFMLIRTWVGAIQLIGVLSTGNITKEKKELKKLLQQIRKVRNKINLWVKEGVTNLLFTLLNDSEVKFDHFFSECREIEKIIELCSQDMKFGNGQNCNRDLIFQTGLFALFDIGKAIGLTHASKNSPLFKFVHIITRVEPKKISDSYAVFKEIIIADEIQGNNVFRLLYKRDEIMKAIHTEKYPYSQRCSYQQVCQ
ncbi:hypothetical protein [Legionella feeleii]|uniref:Uncharacterized protein n=1 Tax=Legionella feeleii TaxID=453 RepID=A0A378IR71_9GAMM|nr:hypothetical protein [Legionella feeleii]STX37707.1 Uncharacterised protein [Legionella feeleii]